MKHHKIISGMIALGASLFSGMLPAAYGLQAAQPPEASKPFLQWGIAVLMFGLCILVLFKNAKRTHKD
jgi:hypothetical protein